jgi:hypothetical protein
MLRRISILGVLAARCASAQPGFPDTPAGRTLKAWFEALNSGDRVRMEAYIQKFDPARPIDNQMNFRHQTGGFDLLSIEKSERAHIEFRVKEKAGSATAIGRIDVRDADPATIVSFGVRAIPPGATEADFKIDGTARQRAIDGAAALLNESYVFPETAQKMEEAIRGREKATMIRSRTGMPSPRSLRPICGTSATTDLPLNFSPTVLPKEPPARRPGPGGQAAPDGARQLSGRLRYSLIHINESKILEHGG